MEEHTLVVLIGVVAGDVSSSVIFFGGVFAESGGGHVAAVANEIPILKPGGIGLSVENGHELSQ